MENNKKKYKSFILIYLLLTSISMAIPFSILIQLEPNQPETIKLTNFESLFVFPFYLTFVLFPYTFLVYLASYLVKLIINRFIEKMRFLFDILIFSTISIFSIFFLPINIQNLIFKTEYNYLINPYLIIPFLGAITISFLEKKKYFIPS
ncbi:hypothetical protein BED47_07780 [Gottfriedia luciferensis]|uniref:Uncharacterized protein n=1 Tax=Gottfriedia luciferensis TaxID=178774 RepID=A0ABX2ZPL5_9BACI|nr:hypothetical protein [Gottfriedia luciferensis]ODG91543.1 hypothetical protein BED47_07780 [Gottfriedia luciferensis]